MLKLFWGNLTMKKKCTIIFNPNASGVKRNKFLIKNIYDNLDKEYNVKLLKSEYPGHLMELVKKENKSNRLLITVGGDGTFGELIKGIYPLEQKCLLYHIPAGTTNDLRTSFGLSKNIEKNLAYIKENNIVNYDIILINETPFSYVAGFGYPVYIPIITKNHLKKTFGHFAYVLRSIPDFVKNLPTYHIRYVADDKEEEIECIMCFITNSHKFGGIIGYPKGIEYNDGKFEVCFIPKMRKGRLISLFRKVVLKKKDLRECNGAICFKTSKLTIDFLDLKGNDKLITDGDCTNIPLKHLEFRIDKQVKIMVPPKKNK